MTRLVYAWVVSLFLILAVIWGLLHYMHYKRNAQVQLIVFKVHDGWGYDIVVNKKTFIHQSIIPAIEQNIPFPDKKLAQKTGELVVQKIKNHKMPSVTIEELISLEVLDSDALLNYRKESKAEN